MRERTGGQTTLELIRAPELSLLMEEVGEVAMRQRRGLKALMDIEERL